MTEFNKPSLNTPQPPTPFFSWLLSLLPESLHGLIRRQSFLLLTIRVAFLLGSFILVNAGVRKFTFLPEAAYAEASLLMGLVERVGYFLAAIVFAGLVFVARYGRLCSTWAMLENGRQLRLLIVFLAALIAWPLVTSGYNYYFDQGYLFERVLLVLLVPLTFWRPAFIFAFVLLAFTMMWQVGHLPNVGFIFPHKLQILNILNLFVAYFFIHAITGLHKSSTFFLLALCLLASAYWEPARSKIAIDWLSHGYLYYMPLAAYAHGWLADFLPETIIGFAKIISNFDGLMRAFVIGFEAGCLLLLFWRKLTIFLLACMVLFHLGVFALYGFFFWTWIALDLVVMYLLWQDRDSQHIDIYGSGQLFISVWLIGFAYLWCSPSSIAWYDTRMTYTYQIEAIGRSGKVYAVPANFFSPYDDIFSMSAFGYTVDSHRQLVGPFGTTKNPEVSNFLEIPRRADEIYAAEEKFGLQPFRPKQAAKFRDFLLKSFDNWNRRGSQYEWRESVVAPRQFWTFVSGNNFTGQERIRELVVRERTAIFDDQHIVEIRNLEIARIAIPEHSGG